MATATEEQQAKEFLKRVEIRTMKKDLLKLREADSLKERDKIVKIKTLEEQMQEQEEKVKKEEQQQSVKKDVQIEKAPLKDEGGKIRKEEQEQAVKEKAQMEKTLLKNENEEREAEKDIKNYAKEEERQQIFMLELERLNFEKQIDMIDNEKDAAIKLEKNQLLIQIRGLQTKLNEIIKQEKGMEGEQKLMVEKSQTTNVPSEKKSLEQRRAEIDGQIQETEKKRWEVEKQIETSENKIKEADKSSEKLVIERNGLQDKILGIDKTLREIYSGIIARVEEQRKGTSEAKVKQREVVAEIRAKEKENVRRSQWRPSAIPVPQKNGTNKARGFEAEEEQRKQFLKDVEQASQRGQDNMQQKSNIK